MACPVKFLVNGDPQDVDGGGFGDGHLCVWLPQDICRAPVCKHQVSLRAEFLPVHHTEKTGSGHAGQADAGCPVQLDCTPPPGPGREIPEEEPLQPQGSQTVVGMERSECPAEKGESGSNQVVPRPDSRCYLAEHLIARTDQQKPGCSLDGGEKGPPSAVLPTCTESQHRRELPLRLRLGQDRRPPPDGLPICAEGVERDALVSVPVHPQQFSNTGRCALWAIPRVAHRDRYQLLLEDHQLGEGGLLVRLKPVGLPVEGAIHDRVLPTGTLQGPGACAVGFTEASCGLCKGSMEKGHVVLYRMYWTICTVF
ncbi:uncharacterized protein [Heptranchias perlo]|uniref:uncharacterized protein n=1 Tax=Heptranchias perlo TaxID=212740 RepID=UPI00355958BB